MTVRKGLLEVLLALSALLIQLTVLNRLPLPLGAPNLVIVVLVAVGLLEGPLTGMLFGFAVGLGGDLLGDHLVGRLALLFTLLGYAAGRLHRDETGVLVGLAAAAGASLLVSVVDNGISILLGNGAGGLPGVARAGLVLAGYDALLTPFVFPLVRVLLVGSIES